MEYLDGKPVIHHEREARDKQVRHNKRTQEDSHGAQAQKGGQPNELGVTQGQNGEQGNSSQPQNNQKIGRPG